MLVVAIGTMALVIVLSVFNGMEDLLRGLYGSVDSNLVVKPVEGKSFEYTEDIKLAIEAFEDVTYITDVLEDNALIKYNNAQRVANVKGISENFIEEGRLDNHLAFGDLKLKEGDVNYAIVGSGVRYDLSINPKNDFYTIQMVFPDEIKPGMTNIDKMYRLKNILPAGVFAIEKSYDDNLVFVPVDFAEELFNKKGKRTSLEIQLGEGADVKNLKQEIQTAIGDQFEVLTNDEVHGGLYKVLSYEKFFVFLAFSVIIGIASINIFFSLSMLAIDKKKDVAILTAQGASRSLVRNIFLFEGCIVAFTGAFTGLALGLLVSFVQQEYGLIGMGMETAIMNAYPVKIEWLDIFFTILCIVCITLITAIQPAINASKNIALNELQ